MNPAGLLCIASVAILGFGSPPNAYAETQSTDRPPQAISLLDRVSQASVEMSIKGESRWALLMEAPGEIVASAIEVPANSRLRFGVGVAQNMWLADGDGMTFALSIRAPGRDVATEIYSRHVDPKHRLQDQRWFDEELSLHEYANRELEFVLTTAPGDDDSNDWGGWSGLELVLSSETARPPARVSWLVASATVILAIICAALILRRLDESSHRARAARLGFSLTILAIPVVFAGITVLPATISPVVGTAALAAVFLIVAAALILVMCRSKTQKHASLFMGVDLVLFNLALAALLTETAIRALPILTDSPLVAWDPRSRMSTIEKLNQQLEPLKGVTYENGLLFNSMGFPDREFAIPKPGNTYRIMALIDSFGVMPMMPYQYNHLTLLETELAGFAGSRTIDVTNLGMVGNSPADYLALLEELGAQLDPDLVLLYFFVGNDFVPFGTERAFANRWDQFETYRVFSRLHRTSRINLRWNDRSDRDDVPISIPDYVHDWRLEEPVIPRDAFMQLERRRARFFDPALSDVHFVGGFQFVDVIADLAIELTGNPLVLVVVPEEMQVAANLRREVEQLLGERLDIERPQRLLRNRFSVSKTGGVILVDLLPRFQRARRQHERVYFPQETHWNAQGNRIAAEEVADQLRKMRERLIMN